MGWEYFKFNRIEIHSCLGMSRMKEEDNIAERKIVNKLYTKIKYILIDKLTDVSKSLSC